MRRNTRSGLSGPFDRGWRSGFSAPFTLGAAGAAAVSDAYAIGGASPELVAAFTLASDGTTAGEYYRKASSETTFSGLFTHSVSGLLTMFDSSGTLVWAPHNLALNSATPATQSITVVSGADYTVECTGVSIALSGAGTGTVTEGNPVTITASTTTLTLTVTGSTGTMWAYRSDLGGMVNNPDRGDSYVPTTSTARYLPRRGHHVYNGSAWVNEGLLHESEARTNLLHTTDALVTQSLTVTAVPHTLHFTGTGTVTLSGASTAGPLVGTGTGENNRVSLTFTPTAASMTLTVTGTVTNAQLEVGSTPSSYIPNLAASGSVTRAAETLTIPSANLPWPTPNVIGPELVTNGTFDTDLTGWTDNSSAGGAIAFNAGRVDLVNTTGTARLEQDVPVTAGRVYAITVQAVALGGSTSTHLYLDGAVLPAMSFHLLGAGTHTIYYVAPDTSLNLSARNFTTGTTVTLDNISVKEIDPLAVSIQIQGQMTYADGDNYDEIRMVRWNNVSASDRIDLKIDTYGARIGTFFAFSNIGGNNYSENTNSVGEYSPGVNVPFNVAGVFTSTEIAGAKDGATDGARSASGQRLPDLENTDLSLGNLFNGTIKLFRIWAADITDAGLEEGTS